MASGGTAEVLRNVLNTEEYNLIPEDVRVKISSHFQERFEEFLTSKALLESSRTNHNEERQTLGKHLEECQIELRNTKTSLTETESELKAFHSKVEELKTDLSALRESVKNYEYENSDLRRQRNEAVDERDSLTRMVERRDAELERLREDVKVLSAELSAAVNAKCEALANAEEVESKQSALDFREKSFEQERDFMKKKIASLTADLNETNAELAIARRNLAAADISLQSQLEAKSEELRILLEKDKQLTESNNELVERIETLSAKLMSQREGEATIVDNYQQELQAKVKLADLYQRMMEDANAKSQELADAIRSLQRLLEDSNKQYSDLQTELNEKELKFNQTVEAKNACIAALKQELKDANDLMKASKLNTMEKAIEGMSPAAAAASKLMKSGLSLTQIYTQYVTVYEELTLQKEENRKLNLYINTIVQELEEKAPILKKQRENYESALESIASLCKQNDQLVEESRVLREDAREAKKLAGHHERENERMKKEISDLSRQVCFLVKSVEEARGGVISYNDAMDTSLNGSFGANDIISKKLVTFRDIEDLQENNKKLLALVRELSNKHEELEANRPVMDMSALQDRVNGLAAELSASKENLNQQTALLEQLVRQRDLYRDMYQKTLKGDPNQQESQRAEITPITSPVKPPHSTVDPGVLASKQRALEEADKRVALTEKQLHDLRTEYEEYRRERRTNEDMLTEQIDKLMSQVRELTNDKLKLTTQAEFQSERFKALLANGSGQKAQITALEEKCKTYSETIAKHELSVKALMQESLSAQAKLSRAEVELDSLRQECSLLRESESRLKREREALHRESSGQTMLLANLESIKMTLERTETEGRLKLEQRLDECTRECIALRRRLQEEQENFKELSRHLERQTAAAVAREEEERKLAQEARQELIVARDELQKKQAEAEVLESKLREATRTPPVVVQRNDEQLTTRVRELENKLACSEEEIKSLKQQVENSRIHLQQYTDIASSSEQQLNEFVSMHEALKSDLEKKLTESQSNEENLAAELSKLQTELSRLRAAGNQTSSDLQLQVKELEAQCKQANDLLCQASQTADQIRNELQAVKQERDASLKAQQESEEKYAHEVTLHSNDIQTLSRLKEEQSSVNARMSELQEARHSSEEALKVGRALFEDREKLMKSQMDEQQQRLNDLEKQNSLLHDQIEALGTQLNVLQAQVGSPKKSSTPATSTSTSATSSSQEGEDFRGPEQLLSVIKFLRREKELAVTRMEVLSTENSRLRAEHDVLVKQTREAVEALEQMKQREQCETVTATRHQDLLRKVETLNAITDSNRLLREERDALRTTQQELVSRIGALEQELNPLREKHNTLSNQVESVRAENNTLKTELTKWRQRVNQLIERANKNSPEDWKRLTNERESLAKQFSAEREAHNKSQDELRMLRQEKTKVEEQYQLLSQRHNALEAEFRKNSETAKKHVEELNGLRSRVATLETELQEQKNNSSKVTEEVNKLNADITARETREQQIRKIAKKYKAQFEELKKSTDEERVQWEAQRAQHENQAAAGVLTPEVKEQLREEGRREVEQKLRDAETTLTEQVRELTSQVTSSQEEAGSLRREIETFKSSEDRAKTVLKNARTRIMLLTEQKAAIEKQLTDSRTSTRDENEARLNVLKSQYEGRIARMEKEKADALAERSREIENLSARLNHLQRMLESRSQGSSKPSTSSHVEKSSSEPPTANIKPMAGPSSSSAKQQTQQTVTVIPWRAGNETPLASIRPMSQSRMAAVQPQQPSGSTAVLMPLHHQQAQTQQQPQPPSQQQQSSQQQSQTQPPQQAVHTTGNSSGAGSSSSSSSSTSSSASASSGSAVSAMDAITSSDYMPATSSASPASVAPIRQVAVPPTQQATVGPSTSRAEEASAESTQDMEEDVADRQTGTSAQQAQQLQAPVQQPQQQAQQQPQQQQPAQPQPQQQQPPPSLPQQQPPQPQQQQQQQQQAPPRESQAATVQAQTSQVPSPQSQPQHGQQTPPQQVVGQAQPQTTPQQQLPPQATQPAQPAPPAQQQQQPPQQQQAQPQQAVAMVLPRERVEQPQVQQQVQQQVHVSNNQPQQPQQQQPQPQSQQVQPPQGLGPSAAGPSQQQSSTASATATATAAQAPQDQSVIVASSQQASSSNTVTTSQSGVKRPREVEGDSSTSRAGLGEGIKMAPQLKRSRLGPTGGDSFQAPAESSECSGLDVEYQVPTSSQRDQEDDIIVVTSEEEEEDEEEGPEDEDDDEMRDEDDDGPEFQPDEDEDNEEGYEMETYDREDRDLAMANYDDVEGPNIDDETGAEQDNEVEIIDDSNEVPNQPGSSSSSSGGPIDATPHVGSSASGEQLQSVTATHILPLQQPAQQPQVPQQPQQPQDQQRSSSEATSSGATNQSDNGSSSSSSSSNGGPSGISNNQVSSQGTPVSLGFVPRSRTSIPPLNRQQLVLGYGDDGGDDGIVPSTPTLFVPRRTDGFGEAVSSPQVPSAGRFTFSDANPPAVRAVPCTPTLFGTRRAEGYSDAFRAMSGRHFTFSDAPTPPSHTGVAQVVCEGMDDTRVDLSQLEDPGTGRSVPTTPLQVSPQGDIAANELAAEVGQSSESDNVDASGSLAGPSSVPSIAVSMAEHQQVECQPPAAQDALDLEMENDQREAGGDRVELVGEQADEPEEVMVLDLEEESADGVSSEGSKPPQPSQSQQALELEMEEGREAEASEPSANSPHGSPHGRGQGSGSGTARRSHTGPRFARRGGRGNQRPTPIVWNEPGSTSPRSMGDGPSRGGRGMPLMPMMPMPMARGMPLDARGFSARGQRARRGRKPYGGGPFNMPY